MGRCPTVEGPWHSEIGVNVDAKEFAMEPISALAWMLGTSIAGGVVAMARIAGRATAEQEVVRQLEQHTTVTDLQRRLADEGVMVRLTFVDSVLGPRLWLDADDLTATMSLYRLPGSSWARLQSTAAILRSCAFVDPVGWHVELETLDGRRVADGWRFDVVPRESLAARSKVRRD